MSELRTIRVCQAEGCQSKGSKSVLHRLQSQYNEEYVDQYPDLRIMEWDCSGDCEKGPVVQVNDSIVLSGIEKEDTEALLQNPESVMGDIMHVLEQDRETFERIVEGDLF